MQKTALIKLQNIEKSYKGRKILENINFNIYETDFISITGASGAGKSTLLNIMALFEKQDKGEYFFEDKPISNKEKDICNIRNQSFGFVFQNYNLISGLSVLENIALPLQYSVKKDIQTEIDRIFYLIDELGIRYIKDEKIENLSGGEKQRVAIARALVNRPKIIFADEPTGNLDLTTRNSVIKIFQMLNTFQKVAIVIVTHDEYVASITTKKYCIKDKHLLFINN